MLIECGRLLARERRPGPAVVPSRCPGRRTRAVPARRAAADLPAHGRERPTGWDGTGDPRPAFNRTEEAEQFGVRGTDLGSSFEHRGRTYFVFGDTWRKSADYPTNMDSVAYATTRPDGNGLRLQFLPEPPVVQGGNVPQLEFEVPLDGVSDGESMFVFFSTGLRDVEGFHLMGRSVLARSADGVRFDYLWDFSADKLVNVSVVHGQVSSELAASWGWPRGTTNVLWLWGSGRYRSSDVYLAVIPFGVLATPNPQGIRPSWTRFFSGRRGAPAWSASEEDATALFCNGSVGELCVRWNPHLSRWLATFNSDNPRGILLHWAEQPWGPGPRRRCTCSTRTTPTGTTCTAVGRTAGPITRRTTCCHPSPCATTNGVASTALTRSATSPRTRPAAAGSGGRCDLESLPGDAHDFAHPARQRDRPARAPAGEGSHRPAPPAAAVTARPRVRTRARCRLVSTWRSSKVGRERGPR